MQQNGSTPRVLRLEGALTLASSHGIRESLLEAIQESRDVLIDCRDATECDLSFVQQLVAVRQAAARRGGTLALAAPAAGPLLDVVKRGGFVDPFWTTTTGDAP
jgi:anti-anti-sigma regulatory factor